MRQVFLVKAGERFEGGSIVSAHHTLAGAVKAAKAYMARRGGDWDAQPAKGPNYWLCDAVDYVLVQTFDVVD